MKKARNTKNQKLKYVRVVSIRANTHWIALDTIRRQKVFYHEVEVGGEISRPGKPEDTKVASTKIKIGAEINIAGLVKAAIEYTTERTKKEKSSDKNRGASSATGSCGASSATGSCGASSATGYKGASSVGNPTAVAVAWGFNSKAKGVLGSYLVFANWEYKGSQSDSEFKKSIAKIDAWEFKGAKMVQVDGDTIKENTWYTIVDGKVVETPEE